MSTEVHEAGHVACAILLGRRVDYTWRETGHALVGEELGHARIPIDKREISQVAICLVGYLTTAEAGWPPDYEQARDEMRERLGLVVRRLGLSRDVYEQLVELTRDVLVDPDFIRLRDAIARALTVVPRLECEDIEALCRATHIPIPEPIGAA